MTQDQWGQPVNPGYVVRGEVVPDDEPGAPPAGQAPPMTHFQKVASRVDQPGRPAGQDPDAAAGEEDRAVSSPDAGHDYWDDDGTGSGAAAPAGQEEERAGEATPDGHDATDPSMTRPDVPGASPPPAATVATVPVVLAGEPAGDGERPAERAEAAQAPEAELRPGESGTTLGHGESGYASLITDSGDLREQWHQIQYKFVDDPRGSVAEAADVIALVAVRLEAAMSERQRGLRARWDTTGAADTETLRETLRMYRSFLDQLIGPEAS